MSRPEQYYRGLTIKGGFAPGMMVEVWNGSRKVKQWPFGAVEENVKQWIDEQIEKGSYA